jgi:catechol-2,3-dioxygenase
VSAASETRLVSGLRGIEIGVPDLAEAELFFTRTWGLTTVSRTHDAIHLRATGPAHHVLALHRYASPDVHAVVFRAPSIDALTTITERVARHGGLVMAGPRETARPGGGSELIVRDPQGRTLVFIAGDAQHTDVADVADKPTKITHVVLNTEDVGIAQRFFEDALGFTLSDRTRIMAFMRCSTDHHCIALADADNNCLNHIAFLMPDLESVMRGGGRMNDAGFPIEWGVGRHGPGNNVFAYFVGPYSFVIEYTAEVDQVGDDHVAKGPTDWTWPPGRIDQWGIGRAPTERLRAAQRAIPFIKTEQQGEPT